MASPNVRVVLWLSLCVAVAVATYFWPELGGVGFLVLLGWLGLKVFRLNGGTRSNGRRT